MSKFVPPFFKDFGKTVNDVFKPSRYDLNRKVEINTKTPSGTKFTVNGTHTERGTIADIQVKSVVNNVVEVTTEAHTAGKFVITGKSINLAEGLTVSTSATTTGNAKVAQLKEEVNYQCNNFAGSAVFQGAHNFSNLRGEVSAVVGSDGISAGGAATYLDNEVADYNLGVEYAEKDFTITVKTANKLESVFASYAHKLNPEATVVGEFIYDLKKDTAGRTLSVGGSYKVDPKSTIYSMLTTKGDGFTHCTAYETSLNSVATLTLSSMMDLQNSMIGSHKFGLKLGLSA